ncbi:Tim17/Tim22/Tim23 family protein [Colletotrichum paranaense]|uniref:Mitochondrial import inner membrane translocase subunit TIM22 n=2 Tax=Colletotrichum acutatum species complex TaxID=2707335 RepID=A0AAI9UBP3_9PEZI|nr:Tim17/Tim22/Tim23 family protein [Colletotrichum paranaense]KAK1454014.1 Tim17/Tim22/Tim23 family protein [Colletotrichum melonis]KAK1538478.1 Tim17/Tim22/Tim23 family protein [Colletotrichum paranaense]
MAFPGGGAMPPQESQGGSPGAAASLGPPDPEMKAMTNFMENCFTKSIMSGVMGFGMGGLFGMFMASRIKTDFPLSSAQMSYDTPFHTATTAGQTTVTPIADLPLRQQLRVGFKDMGTRSYSMAKNFGKVGALFAGIECGIEGLRAKNDLGNGVAAGCLTGGILAKNAGPQAALGGCVAFAAFSAAIDAYMRQPSDE